MSRSFLPAVTAVACSLSAAFLSACNAGSDPARDDPVSAEQSEKPALPIDPLAARDPVPGQAVDPALRDDRPRPVMQVQVVLERLGFAPGVIDGEEGHSTRNAISGFQEANGLPQTGQLDERTQSALARWHGIPATRLVTIPDDFARGPFGPLPKEPADQAALPVLGYESLGEKLAERFHTTVAVLHALNPLADGPAGQGAVAPVFRAGQQIRVPNVGAALPGGDIPDPAAVQNRGWLETLRSLGVGTNQPHAARIVVSKSKGTLRALDEHGKLIGLFTVTTGSRHDPLPLGEWAINGMSYNPKFSYDPSLFWDVPDDKGEHLLPPGPNGPVGVVWIDLTKEHYGIHGTPDPETIGRAQSHGCVRLTNWDAARLAGMVNTATKVRFEA